MTKKQSNKQSTRRGFLTSFLKELNHQELGQTRENPDQLTQVSVLALKYAKNTALLTRIAVKKPSLIEENLYSVSVSGQNASGDPCGLQLQIDCIASHVEEVEG